SLSLTMIAESFSTVFVFFFFQAEDGIRDFHVTGVQTCALPILNATSATSSGSSQCTGVRVRMPGGTWSGGSRVSSARNRFINRRSEERRVGKEWRSRWGGWRE